MNTAPFSTWLARLDESDRRNGTKALRELAEHPGWAFLLRAVGQEQHRTVDLMVAGVHEQAKYADFGGYVRGIKLACDAPLAVISIADRMEREAQLAAEAAQEAS